MGRIRGIPDGTGPYGRGFGPGGGRADGSGLRRRPRRGCIANLMARGATHTEAVSICRARK